MHAAILTTMETQLDTTHPKHNGLSFRDLFEKSSASKYVGASKQKIEDEAYCFLMRKNNQDGSRFTPTVTLPDGRRIAGRREARKFGFFAVKFWENASTRNVRMMETQLQRKYSHLRFIYRKLWQKDGVGLRYDDVYGNCIVYITFNFDLEKHLEKGTLISRNPTLTRKYDLREAGLNSDDSSDDE